MNQKGALTTLSAKPQGCLNTIHVEVIVLIGPT